MYKFCLFGRRLGHSYSPLIHNIIYKKLGEKNIYYLNEFEKDELRKNINKIKCFDIKGANVTIPYKTEAMKYVDIVDEKAVEIGSINTIVNKSGILYGYNTDYDGISMTLDEHIQRSRNHPNLKSKKTNTYLILGYGGGSKSVISYLKDREAKKIYVATRNKEESIKEYIEYENKKYQYFKKNHEKCRKFKDKKQELDEKNRVICGINTNQIEKLDIYDKSDEIVEFVDYREISSISGDIIINTTPVGMYPDIDANPLTSIIVDEEFKDKVYENFDLAFDIIYNPLETKFLKEAKKRGLTTINGLKMLVYQAISSYEKFMESKYSKLFYHEVFEDVENIISKKKIISLVGMPGSGKSTIGKIISSKIGYTFVDLDMEIEKTEGINISEIFKTKGEDYFREVESCCLNKEINKKNIVLSTGGGSIEKKENRDLLKKNSIVIYIDRDIDDIIKNVYLGDRPLLRGSESKITSLYEARKDMYAEVSDIVIKNHGEISKIVSIIEDILKLI